jgi:hypothetical protein
MAAEKQDKAKDQDGHNELRTFFDMKLDVAAEVGKALPIGATFMI